MIYWGSLHGFRAENSRINCDNKGSTFIIIESEYYFEEMTNNGGHYYNFKDFYGYEFN